MMLCRPRLTLLVPLIALLINLTPAPALAIREYLFDYRYGYIEEADEQLSCMLSKQVPNYDFTRSGNATWLLLDHATTRFSLGDSKTAIRDYQKAVESIDFYNQKSFTEQLTQTILQDNWGAYVPDDYEQLLARVYFALALLQEGDISNAYAILRRGEELQQCRRAMYSRTPYMRDYQIGDNALAKYLFGLVLEKRGDPSNAQILYAQANSLSGIPIPEPTNSADAATILFVCHNGNTPLKVSTTVPGSQASAIALEMLFSACCIQPALCNMTGVPVPNLCFPPDTRPIPTSVSVGGEQQSLLRIFDVGQAAMREIDQKIPVLAARGVVRLAARRTLVGFAQQQDPLLGMLCDVGMLIANANTKADIRSWGTLPLTLDVARFDVVPGGQEVTIRVAAPPGYPDTYTFRLKLPPQSLCVINVFNLHPGVTQVVIPERFRVTEGESL